MVASAELFLIIHYSNPVRFISLFFFYYFHVFFFSFFLYPSNPHNNKKPSRDPLLPPYSSSPSCAAAHNDLTLVRRRSQVRDLRPVSPELLILKESTQLVSTTRPVSALDHPSMSMVDSGYKPPTEFVEDGNEALVDLNLTDSTELWLLQIPFSNDFFPDIDGKELSLKLDNDGQLASFEGSSGKVYDFVSFADQEPDETVFVPSATEPKIAGKISRRISVVHYPDPKELKNLKSSNTRHINAGAVTGTTSSRYFPMQSGNPRSKQSDRAASSKGSRQKSSLSEVSEPPNTAKRSVSKSIMSEDLSNQDISMSSHHSHERKSKKRKVKE